MDSSRRRPLTWIPILLAGLVVAALLSLGLGARWIDPGTVVVALFSPDLTNPDHATIWDGRLPRTLLALVAGVALGVAGAVIQGLTRNPLADPGVLGINAGAAFFVVLAVGFLGIESILGYVWFAFAGALLVSLVVYVVGTNQRGSDPIRLALAGVALGAVLTGVGEGLALLRPQAFDQIRAWSVGSLDIKSFTPTFAVLGFVLVGLILALLSARGLNALAMGEDLATTLGAKVRTTRALAVAAVTLLAGSATATAGALIFVGLMVPHLGRRISGPDNRWIMVLSALLAPILLLLADVVGRLVLTSELPAGIVAAFVGAPFLIYLARRRRVAAL